jgi:hypothetical protein
VSAAGNVILYITLTGHEGTGFVMNRDGKIHRTYGRGAVAIGATAPFPGAPGTVQPDSRGRLTLFRGVIPCDIINIIQDTKRTILRNIRNQIRHNRLFNNEIKTVYYNRVDFSAKGD